MSFFVLLSGLGMGGGGGPREGIKEFVSLEQDVSQSAKLVVTYGAMIAISFASAEASFENEFDIFLQQSFAARATFTNVAVVQQRNTAAFAATATMVTGAEIFTSQAAFTGTATFNVLWAAITPIVVPPPTLDFEEGSGTVGGGELIAIPENGGNPGAPEVVRLTVA